MNLFKLSGYSSLALGIASCISLINPKFMMIALLLAILGFIFSTINIFLDTKYEITKKGYSLGYAGMILCSIPVIFLIVLIVKH